jgi:hypothetical protein
MVSSFYIIRRGFFGEVNVCYISNIVESIIGDFPSFDKKTNIDSTSSLDNNPFHKRLYGFDSGTN